VIFTAYDALWASLLTESGVDIILVGDSVGMVLLGYETTTSVTMEEMIHHAKAARRGAPEAFLIGDMPFGSYHQSPQESVANAFRFIREAGCDAIKIEWHSRVVEMVQAMIAAGIAVMGHVGLTPQTASQLGGYKVQGRDPQRAKEILEGAAALEKAGCFSVVLECIPECLAAEITRKLQIPTIGIGAGNHVDGQVLVTQDLLGLFDRFVPRFVKRYANLREDAVKAIRSFRQEVETKKFPAKEQTFR
jgi:3-methyl-2-oxobutanoate hydroxymethyltransferase